MSAFKNWRLRCGMLLLVILLAGCNAKSGLDGDTTAPEQPPPNTENGIALRSIDATKTDQWVYFNLASNAVVYPGDPANSREWDLAFQRFKIKTNSGISGTGGVLVAALKNTLFSAVEAMPTGLEFHADRALAELSDAELISLDAGQFFAVCASGSTCIDAAAGTVDRAHLNTEIAAYAMLTTGGGVMYQSGTARPILGWYNYYFDENHTLKPAADTWVIKSVDGIDIKLEMVGYYGANNTSESGNMAFRYQSLTHGFTIPEAGAAQFKISLEASTLLGTAPLAVDFSTEATGGTSAQWQWDFGDGATSTEMAPSHVYQQPGTYVAKIVVSDQRGARSTQTVTITVDAAGQQPPVANAGADQNIMLAMGATQTQVTLDGSAVPDANIVSYVWNGAPNPNDEPSPVVALAIGSYEFTLTVTDNHGLTSSDTVRVIVASPDNTPPVAQIAATPLFGAMPLPVQFDGAGSSDSGGTVVSYQWDFGDGNSATTAAPQHTYTHPGRYTAKLTVTDDGGATADSSVSVDVVVPVSADTYVYQFQIAGGNQSTPTTPTPTLLVWNHDSDHGGRTLMDFDALDASLGTMTPGTFTATLRLYIMCDLNAGGLDFVKACPGPAYPDVDSPTGYARVTTDIFSVQDPWAENGAFFWNSVVEQTKYATFTVDASNVWVGVDVTTLVNAWIAAGSTGNGIVFSQEAYPVVRADNGSIAVPGFYSKENTAHPELRPYLEIRKY